MNKFKIYTTPYK